MIGSYFVLPGNIETFDVLGGDNDIQGGKSESQVLEYLPLLYKSEKTQLDLACGISGLCNSKQGKQSCITREQIGVVIFSNRLSYKNSRVRFGPQAGVYHPSPCLTEERSSYIGPLCSIQCQADSSTAFAMAQWFYQWSSTEIENELSLICHFQTVGLNARVTMFRSILTLCLG